jgi:hypothetical protein
MRAIEHSTRQSLQNRARREYVPEIPPKCIHLLLRGFRQKHLNCIATKAATRDTLSNLHTFWAEAVVDEPR